MIEEVELQLYTGDYSTESMQDYGLEIVRWPESQELSELGKDWYEHCFLVNDEEGISAYGSAAYVVQSSWYNENCNNSN